MRKRIFEKWFRSRYLRKTVLLMTTSVVAIFILFAAVVYFNVEKTAIENEKKVNRQILLQTKYSMEQLQGMIDRLCLSVFFDSDTISMMYASNQDYVEIISKLNRIRSMYVDLNTFVHSIYIYSKYSKSYFTSNHGLFFSDSDLDTYITKAKGNLPKLKPLTRYIEEEQVGYTDKVKKTVFSYFLYDSLDNNNIPEGGIIVNIDGDWILNSINAINTMDPVNNGLLFFIDRDLDFIGFENTVGLLNQEEIRQAYLNNSAQNPAEKDVTNSFQLQQHGRKYLISYISSEKMGWVMMKVQPVFEVYDYINKLKTSLLFISGIFLLLYIFLALSISGRIYKPIFNLSRDAAEKDQRDTTRSNQMDDISYIRSVIMYSSNQIQKYHVEHTSNQLIVKTFILRKLLLSSIDITEEDFEKACQDNGLSLKPLYPFFCCIFRVDGVKSLKQTNSDKELNMIQTMMMNFVKDVACGMDHFEIIPYETTEREYVNTVLLMNGDESTQVAIIQKSVEQQRAIKSDTGMTISITFSDICENYKQVSNVFAAALSNSMYQYVFGKGSIITSEKVKNNNECMFRSFSTFLERKLSEEIRAKNLQGAEEYLKKIIDEIKTLSYKNMVLSVMHLVNIFSDTVEEMNRVRIETVFTDYNEFQEILDACTIDELYDVTIKMIKKIMTQTTNKESEKSAILSDAVSNIVEANYMDGSLCLQKIADMIKMSSVHVGRVFKNITGKSVAEYINEYRLEKAVDLLCETTDSIGMIAERVGIQNESYFYKLFKRKYGTTPKEFMVKNAIIHKNRD